MFSTDLLIKSRGLIIFHSLLFSTGFKHSYSTTQLMSRKFGAQSIQIAETLETIWHAEIRQVWGLVTKTIHAIHSLRARYRNYTQAWKEDRMELHENLNQRLTLITSLLYVHLANLFSLILVGHHHCSRI